MVWRFRPDERRPPVELAEQALHGGAAQLGFTQAGEVRAEQAINFVEIGRRPFRGRADTQHREAERKETNSQHWLLFHQKLGADRSAFAAISRRYSAPSNLIFSTAA